jgi:exopolysaccharide production protein ExoY
MKQDMLGVIPRWKRTLDLSCVFVSMPLWLPVMLLISLWIKVASRGPVFFRQQRVGYLGQSFLCLKFRSMAVDAETGIHEKYVETLISADVPMTKIETHGDSRLIPCGKVLRVLGLDELPQIFNVIRGEMSLVGPRPCTTKEFEHYLPHHKERVNAPPGLTGLWQVNGKNKTTFREMIEMDIAYGRQMSVSLDLAIMLKTVPALVCQALESRKAKAGAKNEVLLRVVGSDEPPRVASGLHQLR